MQIKFNYKKFCIVLLVLIQILMVVHSAKADGVFAANVATVDPAITWLQQCGDWDTKEQYVRGFYRIIMGLSEGRDELYLQWGKESIDGINEIVKTISVKEFNYHYAAWTIDKITCETSNGKTKVILLATNGHEIDKQNSGKYKILITLGETPGVYELEKFPFEKSN